LQSQIVAQAQRAWSAKGSRKPSGSAFGRWAKDSVSAGKNSSAFQINVEDRMSANLSHAFENT
jgi:hypothetical protein